LYIKDTEKMQACAFIQLHSAASECGIDKYIFYPITLTENKNETKIVSFLFL